MERTDFWKEVMTQLAGMGYSLGDELTSPETSNSKVWRAQVNGEDPGTTRAVKASLPGFFNGDAQDGLEELALREATIYEKIGEHPNIPAFHGYQKIVVGGLIPVDVLDTEFVTSPNLSETVKGQKPKLNENQTIRLLDGILSALSHVHANLDEQVLHRDIKPSNILFNGDHAYLFDFNFSKIGEASRASRSVENSYYPIDAFAGRQTQSQDLAALGNVAICAAYGLEIEQVRDMQNKSGLDAIDLDGLRFSPKMKSFLRKLTSPKPALRYQTADQALEDLRNLETITEETLDEKVSSIVRSKSMQDLLGEIKKKDDLFDYNVPPSLLTTLDDDSLLEHLERTYSQEKFIVDDAIEVARYIKPHDRVVRKGRSKCLDVKVSKGYTGKIIAVNGDNTVRVEFNEAPYDASTYQVSPADLIVLATGWRKKYRLPAPSHATEFGVKEGYRVEYTGEDLGLHLEIVPDGTEGIVGSQFEDSEGVLYSKIVWASKPGLVVETPLHWGAPPAKLTLVRPNQVNFRQMYEQAFGETPIVIDVEE